MRTSNTPGRFPFLILLAIILVGLRASICFAQPVIVNKGTIESGQTISASLAENEWHQYFFTANAGDSVNFLVGQSTAGTLRFIDLALFEGDWISLRNAYGQGEASIRAFKVPHTGEHFIICRRSDWNALDYSVTFVKNPGTINTASDPDAGTINSGETKSGSIACGDLDPFVFSATAGNSVSILMSAVAPVGAGFVPSVELHAPDGTLVAFNSLANAASIRGQALTQTGDYFVICRDAFGTHASNYVLSVVTSEGIPASGTISSGQTKSGALDAGEMHGYTFSANANDHVTVLMGKSLSGDAEFQSEFQLLSPDGMLLRSVSDGFSPALGRSFEIPETGSYYIVCRDEDGIYSSSYGLSLVKNPGAIDLSDDSDGGPITVDETKNGIISLGDLDPFTFEVDTGSAVTIRMESATPTDAGFDPCVELHAPDGTVIAVARGSTSNPVSDAIIIDQVISQAGTHFIICHDWMGSATSAYTLTLEAIPPAGDHIIYVDTDAVGANDGSAWGNAFTSLESALQAADTGNEIWIAEGTYTPSNDYGLVVGTYDAERLKHFRLKNGVGIYGGFAGTEFNRAQRDIAAHPVILSGERGDSSSDADNCYHVFFHPGGLDSTAILDGVTVQKGRAETGISDDDHAAGGGMQNIGSSPTVSNCTFAQNYGWAAGGISNTESSSPTIVDCTFTQNVAHFAGGGMGNSIDSSPLIEGCTFSDNLVQWPDLDGYGGGMANAHDTSHPVIANCVFSNNSASSGAGIGNSSADPIITNCVFIGNIAISNGGGIFNNSAAPAVINCTFSLNSATTFGGGMSNIGTSSPAVINCIFWNNAAPLSPQVSNDFLSTPQFAYCDIQGSFALSAWDDDLGIDNGGNIDADPLFVSNSDLHLTSESPCADSADGDAAPATDIEGNSRYDIPDITNTGAGSPAYADMGVYECQSSQALPAVVYERGKQSGIELPADRPLGAALKIELVNSLNETWLLTSKAKKSPYKWKVGKWKSKTQAVYPDGGDYRFRFSTLDGLYTSESDEEFAIATVQSILVTGPASVSGGETAQYTSTAHYNFGQDQDVTTSSKWSSTKIRGAKMNKKTGQLVVDVIAAPTPSTVTATYGKAKPPMTDSMNITLNP